jgi:hypothetical protein
MSSWQQWTYVAACLVVPALWGVVSSRLFIWLDKRRAQAPKRTPLDYTI